MDPDKINPGGGSGGDTGADSSGNQIKSTPGTYQIGGNQVVLISRASLAPAKAGPSRIILLAGGSATAGFLDDGEVDIRGADGVRITAGPPAIPMVAPSTTTASMVNGVEIEVGTTQNVTITRGQTPPAVQKIVMTPTGITIDAGKTGILTLTAGLSTITIDASGIKIVGLPLVQINPGPPAPPPPPVPRRPKRRKP